MYKRILFISIDGLSDPLGKSQIIPYLKILADQNRNVSVFSLEKKDKLSKNKYQIQNELKKNNIKWYYLMYTKKMGKIGNLYDYFRVLFYCFYIKIIKKINIIHGRGHTPTLIGFLIKKLFKIFLIFDFRGFWIDERVDNKKLNLTKFLDRYIYNLNKFFEKLLFYNSNKIVCLTKKAKKEIIKISKKNPNDLFIIPCCTDYSLFKYSEKNKYNLEIRKKLKIPFNSIVITYSGSLGGVYLLDEMINFYFSLLDKYHDAYFLILTNNKDIIAKKIKKIQKLKNTDKIIYLNLANEEIPKYLSVTNIFVSFILNSYARIAMSPTKISECLSLGIPVIINNNIGDTEEIIRSNNAGLIFDIKSKNYLLYLNEQIPFLLNLDQKKISENSKKILDINVAKIRYNTLYASL